MKVRWFVFLIAVLPALQNISFANRTLNRSEILEIFQTLTEHPQKTWIQKGTVEAKHIQLETSTGYMAESEEIVRYDGERFVWQITMNSRTKTIVDDDEQKVILEDRFDFNGNKKRVFVWDGASYTMYFESGKQALVYEEPGNIPVAVNGPLTAGIIPWGFGRFSYENLVALKSTAYEVEVDGKKQVHITLEGEDSPKMFLALNPSRKYALLSCSTDYNGQSVIVRTYDDYTLIAERWIPTKIIVEKYGGYQKILSYDDWQLTYISPVIADSFNFSVYFDKGTLVQYHANSPDKPLSYKSNDQIDVQLLLQKKITMELSGEDKAQRNCATVAAEFVLDSMSISFDRQQLRSLIKGNEGGTSLYDLKNFIESKGLYCKAIKGVDIQVLGNVFNNCQTIVYLPKQRHYVVLARVDDEQVWLIDLNERKFLYSIKLDKFNKEMESGAYLLVSDKPLELDGSFVEIEDKQLNQLIGGDVVGYCCIEKIQEAGIGFCSEMTYGGICLSVYTVYCEIYKCKAFGTGGFCFSEPKVSSYWSPCIEDPDNLGACTITGEFKAQYARSCQ
jgi:predicted double-glycine peptidase